MKQAMTVLISLIFVAPACTSMQTRTQVRTEAALSHPEFQDIMDSLRRLEAQLATLMESIANGRTADREGQRDDMEKVMEIVAKQVEELKAEIAKRRQ